MCSQGLETENIQNRKNSRMLFSLILIVLFLNLSYTFKGESVVRLLIKLSNPLEGSQDVLGLFVGDQFDWSVLHIEYESQSRNKNRQDEGSEHDRLPTVDQVEEDRIDEDARRK